MSFLFDVFRIKFNFFHLHLSSLLYLNFIFKNIIFNISLYYIILYCIILYCIILDLILLFYFLQHLKSNLNIIKILQNKA